MKAKQVLEHLQNTQFYDITEIKNKQAWAYLFTKQHQDKTWTQEWVEDYLLIFEVDAVVQRVLFFYRSMFSFDIKNGRISMMVGEHMNKEDQETIKKKIGWKKDQIVICVPAGKDKSTFKLLASDQLMVLKATEFSEETKKMIRDQVAWTIKQKLDEVQGLVKELT